MPATLPPDVTFFVVRIKVEEDVFYAPLANLLEELDGLRYQGFGTWKGGTQYRLAVIDRLLAIQKDLRLFVCFPDDEIHPCDLSEEEISADPFEHIAQARRDDTVLWEFIPTYNIYKPATSPKALLHELAQTWEKALF